MIFLKRDMGLHHSEEVGGRMQKLSSVTSGQILYDFIFKFYCAGD